MNTLQSIRCLFGLVSLASLAAAAGQAQQGGRPQLPAPTPEMLERQRLSQEDRQRMLDLLHITSLRKGVDARDLQAPNRANYEESKANPYPKLPDPLVMKSGKPVTNAKMWWDQRRPEIVEDFDREIYGRMPKVTPRVKWEENGRQEWRCADYHETTGGPRRQFLLSANRRRHPTDLDHSR